MDKATEKKLRSLSVKQADALKTFILRPAISSGATGYNGRSLGGIISSLHRNGLIDPLGKENRQFRWEIADENLKKDLSDNFEEVIELLAW